jgi:hypothetical protein
MTNSKMSLTIRVNLAIAICFVLALSSVSAAGSPDRRFQSQDETVLLEYPSDTIQMDKTAGLLWVNRQAIAMTPEFLHEIHRAELLVAGDPSELGIARAAAVLSRESLMKLDLVRDALNQPDELVSLRGMEQCGPDGLRLGITMIAFAAACGAVSGGAAAGPCYLAIAAWTGSTWKLGDCLGRHQPRGGRGGGDHDPNRDRDGDGVRDTLDACPFDPLKSEFGVCGCGVPDEDADGDGTLDCVEICPAGDLDCEDDDDECTPIEILAGDCV